MIKSLLYLAILTTAVVFSLIGFSVYHNYTTSTISRDTNIRITPIEGQFDRETIERIKAKRVIKADLSEPRQGTVTVPPATSGAETKVSTQSAQGSGVPNL